MKTRLSAALVAAVVALAVPAIAQDSPSVAAPRRDVVATDLLRIRSATDIDVARDGSRAVYAVRSIAPTNPDAETTAAYRSHLFVVDLERAGATPRRLTWGDREDHQPRLSPDGRTLAFARHVGDLDQIWVIPLDGGEARAVTDLEHGASDPRWSPDGSRLLFSSAVPFAEIDGTPPWPREHWRSDWSDGPGAAPDVDGDPAALRAWLAESAERGRVQVIGRLHFQGEHDLQGPLTVNHVFVVDPFADEPAQRITDGFIAVRGARWMPNGASIAAVQQRDETRHPDEELERSIVLIDPATGARRPVMDEAGWTVYGIEPGADGRVIAFQAEPSAAPSFGPARLGVATLPGPAAPDERAPPVWLTSEDGFDVSVYDFAWMPERSAILFTAPVGGGFPLFTMGLGLIEPATVVDRAAGLPIGIDAFGVGGGTIVYAVTHPSNPSVLRARDARGDRMLDNLNPWLRDRDLVMPTPASVERADGTTVEYWVMEPARRTGATRAPVVVEIHGGPHVMWGPGESTMWHEFQYLCAQGYGVAYANPRGSDGYGTPFRRANEQDWGDGPGGDVLAMADEVALLDWVDRDRMVVTGGSYGGYLTAWIVAHDHRFKAAVAQRGVYEFDTFFGEGNAWELVPWEMGGYPWDVRVRPVLQRESPFTDVHRIRTPLLIMHASDDLRTGVSQSEMMYRALKVLGRPVEYVRYPDAGHDLSRSGDPMQRLDRLGRIVEFFDRALADDAP